MYETLFNGNPAGLFGMERLRQRAAEEVRSSQLIELCAMGDLRAATALHIGFWPFVSEFERAIDQHVLDRRPLQKKYGAQQTGAVLRGLRQAVREMKEDEGSHAECWRSDAQDLGVVSLESAEGVRGVFELIETSYTPNHARFFAVLAGTEFIAEELSDYLVHSPAYTTLFPDGRWKWGDIHLEPHEDGPSHLEIDLDLALAYSQNNDRDEIEKMIEDTIRLFGAAAVEVANIFLPARRRSFAPGK